MKKRLTSLLALLLALVLLAGCSLRPATLSDTLREKLSGLTGQLSGTGGDRNPEGVKFSQMRYERPDTEKLASDVQAVKDALDRGAELAEVEELLDLCMDDYYHFDTMYSLANILNCRDLRDESCAAEFEWCAGESPTVSRLFDEMYYACAGSALGAALEEDYFWEGFCEEYDDPSESNYTDASVALMERESELISRYRELVADPVVGWRGEERGLHELLDELEGFSYLQALLTYYIRYNEDLAELYIDLMRTRSGMAAEMGYADCEEMQYDFIFDRDYTPDDAAQLIEDVKTYLVPIYQWAVSRGLSSEFDASPLSSRELYAALRSITADIGGDCAEAFSFMDRYELCDIEPSVYKAETSFETYLSDYDAPFIFLDPTETTHDVLTFVHEFGHFTDAYVNYNASESLDLAECFSQGLEFLSLWHMQDVFDDDQVEELRYAQVLDALDTFVCQCAFAEFERRACALGPDALDAKELNRIALETAKDFGFCRPGLEIYYQYYWMDIVHFFEYPFYVISYPVSLDIAMQLYELELQEEGRGLAKYREILPRDYEGFMETIEKGGLVSPFEEGGIRSVAEAIAETLGYDGRLAEAA